MSERKVFNKYFPTDFDPKLIPKATRDARYKTRIMIPFSCRCDTCGQHIPVARKFNATKENANENYLGIAIFRFYLRCPCCAAEITFKTDPENNDYICEHGAKRSYDHSKYMREEARKEREDRAVQASDADIMGQLDKKTTDLLREQAELDQLEEMMEKYSKLNSVDLLDLRARERKSVVENVNQEEDLAIEKEYQKMKLLKENNPMFFEIDDEDIISENEVTIVDVTSKNNTSKSTFGTNILGKIRKRIDNNLENTSKKTKTIEIIPNNNVVTGLTALGVYNSDSDSD